MRSKPDLMLKRMNSCSAASRAQATGLSGAGGARAARARGGRLHRRHRAASRSDDRDGKREGFPPARLEGVQSVQGTASGLKEQINRTVCSTVYQADASPSEVGPVHHRRRAETMIHVLSANYRI